MHSTIPHPLYSSPHTQICLITIDPPAHAPRAYKNLINHPNFPKDLRTQIIKVTSYSKLIRKYKDYEKRRQLFSEFDVFLADERILHLLPVALGRIFYKSTTKRPIPVSLTGKENWGPKQRKTVFDRLKPKAKLPSQVIGEPADVAVDIEKTLATTSIHLAPSTSMCIKVAYAGWPSEWIAENVNAVVARAVAKYVPKEWQGLKSIHLKGPATAALPIWLANELWHHESDIQSRDNSTQVVVVDKGVKGADVRQAALSGDDSDPHGGQVLTKSSKKRSFVEEKPVSSVKTLKRAKKGIATKTRSQQQSSMSNVEPMDSCARTEYLIATKST